MIYLADVASLEYIAEKCTGCGLCVDVCPRGVWFMENKRAAISDRDMCMECGACAANCAYDAIKVLAGVGCAAAIINGMISGGEPDCGCGAGGKADGCC
jgi:NAD-dependent dihydropyrimidine dehydrogenase PreA subunit